MSGPKELNFEDIQPRPQPETAAPSAPSNQQPQSAPAASLLYASRFASQQYHPVVFIGSAAAGKTVLLLSLLAFFRATTNERRLSAFFGDDLLRPNDREQIEQSRRYFNLTVSDYVRGTADSATRIGSPMFIPVRISGENRPEVKFAFMESDGEWYQPDRRTGSSDFFPPFKPELEALLRQYSDGISFVWVAPHMAGSITGAGAARDAEELTREADESLLGALGNYEAIRRNNSARDSHMLLVTKWDTYLSNLTPADIRLNLDRSNDSRVKHEVDGFLRQVYASSYARFQALNSPNKVVFRYSAGLFASRDRFASDDIDEVLRTYPRDIWNWLYAGMQRGHEWSVEAGPLIPPPPRPKKTLLQQWDELLESILG